MLFRVSNREDWNRKKFVAATSSERRRVTSHALSGSWANYCPAKFWSRFDWTAQSDPFRLEQNKKTRGFTLSAKQE